VPDLFDQAKTEAPTPRRREQARRKGQIARSNDLSSSTVVLSALLVFWIASPSLGRGLVRVLRTDLAFLRSTDVDPDWVMQLAWQHAWQLGGIALPVALAAGAVSLGLGLLQSGFAFSTELLAPNAKRLSPANGARKLMSMPSLARGGFDLLKLLGIGLIVWTFVRGRTAEISRIDHGSLASAVSASWRLVLELAMRIAGLLLLLGLADFSFQWWRNEQDLRMSREELKEEQKEEQGDPAVRNRIKRLQRESRKRQMLRHVPDASVIITNPTHLAVAIRYDRQSMAAPVVVAKGSRYLAKTIVRIARQHDIPVLERKPLARALYQLVDVNQEIPVTLYRAVAEILAYIYQLGGKHV
jgi:flagellar biosynthetic protein FlhB